MKQPAEGEIAEPVLGLAPRMDHCRAYLQANRWPGGAACRGFWSILKRGVVGTFHKVSRKYLPLYVAEFEFRYNNRGNPDIFRTAIAGI